MRIIILVANSIAGQMAVRTLLSAFPDYPVEIFLIDQVRGQSFEKYRRLVNLLRKRSWRFLFYKMFETSGFGMICRVLALSNRLKRRPPDQRLMSIRKLAEHYGVPLRCVSDVNDASLQDRIQQSGAVVVISAYITQIIDAAVLRQTPQCRWLNVHSSLLPHLRGAAPYFWALYRNDRTAGVTVHDIVPLLDAGPILAQKEVTIAPDDTVFSLHIKLIRAGLCLLVDVVARLCRGESIDGSLCSGDGSRYGLPSIQAVLEFRTQGRYFIRLRDRFLFFQDDIGMTP